MLQIFRWLTQSPAHHFQSKYSKIINALVADPASQQLFSLQVCNQEYRSEDCMLALKRQAGNHYQIMFINSKGKLEYDVIALDLQNTALAEQQLLASLQQFITLDRITAITDLRSEYGDQLQELDALYQYLLKHQYIQKTRQHIYFDYDNCSKQLPLHQDSSMRCLVAWFFANAAKPHQVSRQSALAFFIGMFASDATAKLAQLSGLFSLFTMGQAQATYQRPQDMVFQQMPINLGAGHPITTASLAWQYPQVDTAYWQANFTGKMPSTQNFGQGLTLRASAYLNQSHGEPNFLPNVSTLTLDINRIDEPSGLQLFMPTGNNLIAINSTEFRQAIASFNQFVDQVAVAQALPNEFPAVAKLDLLSVQRSRRAGSDAEVLDLVFKPTFMDGSSDWSLPNDYLTLADSRLQAQLVADAPTPEKISFSGDLPLPTTLAQPQKHVKPRANSKLESRAAIPMIMQPLNNTQWQMAMPAMDDVSPQVNFTQLQQLFKRSDLLKPLPLNDAQLGVINLQGLTIELSQDLKNISATQLDLQLPQIELLEGKLPFANATINVNITAPTLAPVITNGQFTGNLTLPNFSMDVNTDIASLLRDEPITLNLIGANAPLNYNFATLNQAIQRFYPQAAIEVSLPAGLLNVNALTFTQWQLIFNPQTQKIMKVTVAGQSSSALNLAPSLPTVNEVTFSLAYQAQDTDQPVALSGSINATLVLTGDDCQAAQAACLAINMQIPPATQNWQLQIQPVNHNSALSISQLGSLFVQDNPLDIFPSPLRELGNIQLNQLMLATDQAMNQLTGLHLDLSAPRWTLIDNGLALQQLRLQANVSRVQDHFVINPGSKIDGSIKLGEFDLPLQLGLPFNWQPVDINFPDWLPINIDFASLQSLFNFDFSTYLPSGFSILDNISLDSFNIQLNYDLASLLAFDFSLSLNQPFELLPGWLTLHDVHLSVSGADLPHAIDLTANIKLGDINCSDCLSLPVKLQFAGIGKPWLLSLNMQNDAFEVSLADFASIFGDANLLAPLPAGLNSLADLTIHLTTLDIAISADFSSLKTVNFAFHGLDWELTPLLQINNVALAAKLKLDGEHFVLAAQGTQISGNVTTSLPSLPSWNIPINLNLPFNEFNLPRLSLASFEVPLQLQFADLFNLSGLDLTAILPEALISLSDINFPRFNFIFDPDFRQLQGYDVQLALNHLPLFDNLLELHDINLQLRAIDLSTADFAAELTAKIQIGEVECGDNNNLQCLPIRIVKPNLAAPWQLQLDLDSPQAGIALSIEKLAGIFNGADLLAPLPGVLHQLTDYQVNIMQLDVIANANLSTLQQVNTTISLDELRMLDVISAQDVTVSATLDWNASGANFTLTDGSLSGAVTSSLGIPRIPFALRLPFDDFNLPLLQLASIDLPLQLSWQALFDLTGLNGFDFNAILPSHLLTLPSVTLPQLDFKFNLDLTQLLSVNVTLQLDQFNLLNNLLRLQQVVLQLAVPDVSVPNISAELDAIIPLGDIDCLINDDSQQTVLSCLPIRIIKNNWHAPWQIQLALEPPTEFLPISLAGLRQIFNTQDLLAPLPAGLQNIAVQPLQLMQLDCELNASLDALNWVEFSFQVPQWNVVGLMQLSDLTLAAKLHWQDNQFSLSTLDNNFIAGNITAALPGLSDFSVPVTLSLPIDISGNLPTLQLAQWQPLSLSVDNLFDLTGLDLTELLPHALSQLDTVTFTQFNLWFNTDFNRLLSYEIKLQLDHLPLFNHLLDIHDVELTLSAANIEVGPQVNTADVSAELTATLQLGDADCVANPNIAQCLPIKITKASWDAPWELQLNIDQASVTISLAELSTLFNQADLLASLPQGMVALAAVDLTELRADLSADLNTLERVQVGFQRASMDLFGAFSLQNLAVQATFDWNGSDFTMPVDGGHLSGHIINQLNLPALNLALNVSLPLTGIHLDFTPEPLALSFPAIMNVTGFALDEVLMPSLFAADFPTPTLNKLAVTIDANMTGLDGIDLQTDLPTLPMVTLSNQPLLTLGEVIFNWQAQQLTSPTPRFTASVLGNIHLGQASCEPNRYCLPMKLWSSSFNQPWQLALNLPAGDSINLAVSEFANIITLDGLNLLQFEGLPNFDDIATFGLTQFNATVAADFSEISSLEFKVVAPDLPLDPLHFSNFTLTADLTWQPNVTQYALSGGNIDGQVTINGEGFRLQQFLPLGSVIDLAFVDLPDLSLATLGNMIGFDISPYLPASLSNFSALQVPLLRMQVDHDLTPLNATATFNTPAAWEQFIPNWIGLDEAVFNIEVDDIQQQNTTVSGQFQGLLRIGATTCANHDATCVPLIAAVSDQSVWQLSLDLAHPRLAELDSVSFNALIDSLNDHGLADVFALVPQVPEAIEDLSLQLEEFTLRFNRADAAMQGIAIAAQVQGAVIDSQIAFPVGATAAPINFAIALNRFSINWQANEWAMRFITNVAVHSLGNSYLSTLLNQITAAINHVDFALTIAGPENIYLQLADPEPEPITLTLPAIDWSELNLDDISLTLLQPRLAWQQEAPTVQVDATLNIPSNTTQKSMISLGWVLISLNRKPILACILMRKMALK
jgi:hypothetical protein